MRRPSALFFALLLASTGAACAAQPPTPPVVAPVADPHATSMVATGSPTDPPSDPRMAALAGSPDPSQIPTRTPNASDALNGLSWPLFHGDIGRTGLVDAPSITSPLILWRARVGVQGFLNAPVLTGSLVLVPSSGDKHNAADALDGLHALDIRTGKPVWHAHFKGDANGAAVNTDRAFATSDDGTLYAIDLQSGKVVWTQRGQGKMYTTPLLLGDRVIVGDSTGVLRAFATDDGAPLFRATLRGAIRGGASADVERIYAVSMGGEAIATNHAGKEIWRRKVTRPGFDGGAPVPIEAYAAPVVTPTSLIITFARDTSYDSPAVLSLDKRTGKLLWEAPAQPKESFGNIRSTPALTEQGLLVYAEPYSGDVVGLDVKDGSIRYRRTVGPCFFPQWASPAATADLVYVPRFDGALYALRADTGRPVWQVYLGDDQKVGARLPNAHVSQASCEWEVPSGAPLYAPPAIAEDGTVFIGSGQGILYAIADNRGR